MQQRGADPKPGKCVQVPLVAGLFFFWVLWVRWDDLLDQDNVMSANGMVLSSSSHAAESVAQLLEMKPEWKVMFVHS